MYSTISKEDQEKLNKFAKQKSKELLIRKNVIDFLNNIGYCIKKNKIIFKNNS